MATDLVQLRAAPSYPRPSAANRFVRCPASEVLPAATREESPQASRGTAIHSFLRQCREVGRDAALETTPAEHLPYCELVDVDALPTDRDMFAAELRLWWYPSIDRAGFGVIHPTDEAAAGGPPYTGTADVVAVDRENKRGYIGDYKTGRGYQPPAAEHWQLRSYALMLAKVYGLTSVTTQLIRLDEDGTPWRSTYTLDEVALAETEARLRLAFAWIAKLRVQQEAELQPLDERKPLPVAMGPHCTYCPSYTSCPGQVGLALALARDPEAVAAEIRSQLTLERAAVAYRKFQMARLFVNTVGAELKAFAEEQGGIDLGDGNVYGPTERQHTSLDAAAAFDVLAARYGPVVASQAVVPSTSMAAIEAAVRAELGDDLSKRGTWKAEKEELRAELEKGGAIAVTTRPEVREHRR